MAKMGKRKLISIVRQYIDVPKEKEVEYKYYGGFSVISFYAVYNEVITNVDREYFVTAKYTIFLGEEIIELEAVAVDKCDRWRKIIKI